jgi:hypothetical protein
LPDDALAFPALGTDLTNRHTLPGRVTTAFIKHVRRLGFPMGLSIHNLRSSHETVLPDCGVRGRCA